MDLLELEKSLEAFATINPTGMPLHHVQVFIFVCQNEGCTYAEVEEALNLTNSTVSRTINALGETHRKGYKGFELLEVHPDPEEGRRFTVWLKPKGKALKRQLEKI